MTDTATTSDSPTNAQVWAERCMSLMGEVLDQTADMARMIHTRTTAVFAGADEPQAMPADLTLSRLGLAFDRVSRSFRHVVALGGKVAAELDGHRAFADQRRADREAAAGRAERKAQEEAAQAARAEAVKRGQALRARAAVLLEDQIRTVSPYSEREDFLTDLESCLEDDYEDVRCADLAVPDIINRLCREMRIAADWSKIPRDQRNSADRRADAGQQVFAAWPQDGSPPPRPEPPKPLSALEDYRKHRYANEPPDG